MNEFVLYEQLRGLQTVASRYPAGETCAAQIRETADRIVSQLYRVAVIGEFKRGKSSLINAIIGADVLPTDILPMTAAITRLTYGEKRQILIQYKDGHTEERTVEELIDFATKADAQKEMKAETIREIEVRYPSVFCKNHIDILDTPGLNDNAAMTEVTLSILGEVDAAIMVVSAREPLSLTEQELILKLLKQKGIRHIVFVVTHIDAVSNRKSQQDRVIGYIRDRITGEVLTKARQRFEDDPVLSQKAEKILSQPDIYGVSSVLAMEGFFQDNLDLLDESRFPVFKQELFALLTAAQSADVRAKALDAAEAVCQGLPAWQKAAENDLQQQIDHCQAQWDVCDSLLECGELTFREWMLQMDAVLLEQGITTENVESGAFETNLRNCFIRNLSAITESDNTEENVRGAVATAGSQAMDYMSQVGGQVRDEIHAAMAKIAERYEKIRFLAGLPEPLEPEAEDGPIPSLEFAWHEPVMATQQTLLNTDIMPHIRQLIHHSILFYLGNVKRYVRIWQKQLERQFACDLQDRDMAKPIMETMNALLEQKQLLALQCRLDEEQVQKICAFLLTQQGGAEHALR